MHRALVIERLPRGWSGGRASAMGEIAGRRSACESRQGNSRLTKKSFDELKAMVKDSGMAVAAACGHTAPGKSPRSEQKRKKRTHAGRAGAAAFTSGIYQCHETRTSPSDGLCELPAAEKGTRNRSSRAEPAQEAVDARPAPLRTRSRSHSKIRWHPENGTMLPKPAPAEQAQPNQQND